MLTIGCHLSASKGFLAMGKTALSIGANTFQFFTRNPRGGTAKAMDPNDAAALRALMEKEQFPCILAHAPYTLNACSADEKIREFACRTMADDLARMEYLPGNFYNFHPGSHVGQGTETGIGQIAAMLNSVMRPDQATTVLLETMAGKGSEVGRTFQELAAIRSRCKYPEKLGVCLDTCHVWDAGYDIAGDPDGVLEEFDRVIGLERLFCIHLNDSLNPLGAHKDRHACLGEGKIGLDALMRFIRHPALRGKPLFLETPNDLNGYAREIALVRERAAE